MLHIRKIFKGGKVNKYYEFVVIQEKSATDSIFLDRIGSISYNNDVMRTFYIHSNKLKYWLANGAIPSEQVYKILRQFLILN